MLPFCILWLIQPQKISDIMAQDFCCLSVPELKAEKFEDTIFYSTGSQIWLHVRMWGQRFKKS